MKIQKLSRISLILFMFVACAVAVPRTARMYDLDKGTIIEGLIKDARQTHGIITAENRATGERFAGEYTSITDDRVKSSFGIAASKTSGYATGGTSHLSYSGYGWANAYGFSFDQPRKIFGAATIVGDKGTVIEIVYAVDRRNLHGHGVGRDNKGNRYKVHF